MKDRISRVLFAVIVAIVLIAIAASFKTDAVDIPTAWDVAAIEEAHLPPPDINIEVEYAPKSYYDSLPEHVIYKTYPVFAKASEPPGYLDSLRKLDPEIVFDASTIKTEEDWIDAGEKVFFWPVSFSDPESIFFPLLDSEYFKSTGDPILKNGVYPFYTYVIKEKGKVLIGSLACSNCHTRVTKNGELITGGQGNHAFDANFGYTIKKYNIPADKVKEGFYQLSGTPLAPGVRAVAMHKTQAELIADLNAAPPGVMSRQGMAYYLQIRVPSLIGVRDLKYLDHTGLMQHRGPADLMRYAALNQGMDWLTSYNGFIPMGDDDFSKLPATDNWQNPLGYDPYRYTDVQLYALTQFIYSLKPPKNPNHFPEELLKRGEQVFKEQGCVTCHTPPLYTNNMLTPVDGFDPPKEHYEKYRIFNVSVETDPTSTLRSRRGTGYYKIPSLRGVWYRGPFFHNGELATLEDVLDPNRLKDDYIPTGFKPANVATWPAKGHDFGLDLSDKDKKALIAFLKSL